MLYNSLGPKQCHLLIAGGNRLNWDRIMRRAHRRSGSDIVYSTSPEATEIAISSGFQWGAIVEENATLVTSIKPTQFSMFTILLNIVVLLSIKNYPDIFKTTPSKTVVNNKYDPIAGSSYIPLPKKLKRSLHIFNIQNVDPFCFIWCVLVPYVYILVYYWNDDGYKR